MKYFEHNQHQIIHKTTSAGGEGDRKGDPGGEAKREKCT
jgi:hypothetical protein